MAGAEAIAIERARHPGSGVVVGQYSLMKRQVTFPNNLISILLLVLAALACTRGSEQVIVYVTATPPIGAATPVVTLVNLSAPTITPNKPTPTLISPTSNPLQ